MYKNNIIYYRYYRIYYRIILFTIDSTESAKREIAIFFKDFDLKKWHDNEEIFYNLGKLHFDPISFVHTIDRSYLEKQNEYIRE